MTPRETIRAALADQNVLAFLAVIRRGESSNTADAYGMINGGGRVASFAHHPYDNEPSPPAKASGAYQFLGTTWHRLALQYPQDMADFSPPSQDFAAVADIAGRGALDDIIAGRFEDAVAKLRPEWTSLPGAAENNPRWNMDAAKALYSQYGGLFEPQRVLTTPAPTAEPVAPSGAPMPILAILSAFGPILAQLIPQIKSVVNPQTEVANRNLGLAQLVLDTITKAADAANVQQAVEKMQADPAVLQTVKTAVVTEPTIMDAISISGAGIESARAANVQLVQSADVWWKLVLNPVLLVTMMTLPLVYIIVVRLVAYMEKVSSDVIAQTIGTVIGLVLGGIMGFWMGQTYNQNRNKSNTESQPQG